MGDFNIELLKCNDNYISRSYLYAIKTCSLISTIAKPTRTTYETATLLGNIFFSNPVYDTFAIKMNNIPYHLLIFIIKGMHFIAK